MLWTRSVISSSGTRTTASTGGGTGGGANSGSISRGSRLRSGAEVTADTTSRTDRDLEQGVDLDAVEQNRHKATEKTNNTKVELTRFNTASTDLRAEQDTPGAGPSKRGVDSAPGSARAPTV